MNESRDAGGPQASLNVQLWVVSATIVAMVARTKEQLGYHGVKCRMPLTESTMPRNAGISKNIRLKRRLVVLATATIGAMPTASYAAGLLSGYFAGTAIDSEYYRPPFGTFDGSRIAGTFLVDLTGCASSKVPAPYPGSCLASATSFLTATIPGQLTTFAQPETLVQVFNTPSTQRLSITFGFTNPYSGATLELVGSANAFIDGTDYSSLRPGMIDLAGSRLRLGGGRDYRAGVALSSFTLDEAGTSVPDAPTWVMLLAGFAVTGLATRARSRTAGVVPV